MAVSRDLRIWVRCLQWAWRCIALSAVILGGFATLIIINDEADHDDDWDGLGTFFGLIGAGFAAVLLLLSIAVLVLLAAGWRRVQVDGAVGRLRIASVITILAAIGWLWIAIGLTARGGSLGVMVATMSPSALAGWFATMVLTSSRGRSTDVLQSLPD